MTNPFPADDTEGDELSGKDQLKAWAKDKPRMAVCLALAALAGLSTIGFTWTAVVINFSSEAGWAAFATVCVMLCGSIAAGLSTLE